jgi:parallel beta-helix repeat protein
VEVPTSVEHATLMDRVTALETQTAALESQATSLSAAVTALQASDVATAGSMATLTGRVAALETQAVSLVASVAVLQAAATTASADIATLNTRATSLEAQAATTAAALATLTADLAALTARTTAAEAELASHDGEILALTNVVAALAARLTALETPALPPPPPPPSTLTGVDIGSGVSGSTSEITPGFDYDVAAGGVDIYGTADAFHFSHKQITGDFDQVVKLHAFSGPDVAAKAGLMARETLTAGSRNILMGATINNNGYRFQHRSATDGTTTKVEGGTVAYPNVWVRLTRVGNVFTGYTSPDGITWTQFGQQTVALPSQVYVGLASNSHISGTPASVQYRALGAPSAPPAPSGYTPSGPLVATTGQTITGIRITGAGTTCIKMQDVSNVIINNVQLENCGGHGVSIINSTNIKVVNSLIAPGRTSTTLDSQNAVHVRDSVDVLVQGNILKEFESGVHVVGGKRVTVKGNYGESPKGPFPRGQFVQMYPCNRDGIQADGCIVEGNYFFADEPASVKIDDRLGVEDAINVGSRSMWAKIINNYVKGGRAMSGCGAIFEGGVDRGLISGNVIIRTSGCGINVVAAAWNTVENNKVLDPNLNPYDTISGSPAAPGNIGIGGWYHPGDTRCHDNVVQNNIVSNLLPNGTYNDIWGKSGCFSVNTGNTKGSAARALLVPEATFLPPPAIPPIPWTP